MMLSTGLEIPREQIEEICRRYQVIEMSIFGSTARGEARPDSDVDVLVVFAPGAVYGLEYFQLQRELGEILGRRVDLATKKWLKPWVRAEILRDARVIYAA